MEDNESRIETIARGICVKDGYILLCRGKAANNLYFPGGHIEFGETGAVALEREILEEAGLRSKAGDFLGICEHTFIQHGTENHAEINLVYALDIPDISPKREVIAKEEWIAFDWMRVEELASSRVQPKKLAEVVLSWLGKSGNIV